MSDKPEYGKRCQKCWKYRLARMFFRRVGGKFIRLCKECWMDEVTIDTNSTAKRVIPKGEE